MSKQYTFKLDRIVTSISEYWSEYDLPFHTFMQGAKSICFEKTEEALAFEKIASNAIEHWLHEQWIEFEKIQSIFS